MVLVLAVPLSDPWLPLNALGVPLGGKGTAARAAKSCQGQAIASNCRQNPCILYLHFQVFGLSGCRVFRFSGSDYGQGPCKVHDFGFYSFRIRACGPCSCSIVGHPLAALGVPVGDKGTPARAAKSCQGLWGTTRPGSHIFCCFVLKISLNDIKSVFILHLFVHVCTISISLL